MDIYLSVDYCTVHVRTSYLWTVSRTVSINSGSAGEMRSYRSISREKIRKTFSRNWLPGAQVWTLISDLYSFYRFYIIPPCAPRALAPSLIESLIRFPSEINYSSESGGWWWQTASLSASHYSLHVTAFPFLRFQLTSSSTKVLY